VIGGMLILSVPLRRLLRYHGVKIGDGGLALGSFGYGVVVGGTAGSGVILLSLLMAAGVEGAGVIATDAAISIVIGIVKISVFGIAGVITTQVIAFALLTGLVALPGAFLAKACRCMCTRRSSTQWSCWAGCFWYGARCAELAPRVNDQLSAAVRSTYRTCGSV
jgi:hypothetical protein